MRFLGLGAKVMEKFGVKTLTLSWNEVLPALKKGKIDAAEFASTYFDISLGLYKHAKFNYYPGWLQQTNVVELVINKKKWDRLNKAYQTIINTTCDDTYLWSSIKTNEIQADVMLELKKNVAIFIRWEESELKKLENAWKEVGDEIVLGYRINSDG